MIFIENKYKFILMNDYIIELFDKLIFLLKQSNKLELDIKVKKINSFRIKQLIHAADVISKLDYNINFDNIHNLMILPGIGKGTIRRIKEILTTNNLNELISLEQNNTIKIKLINDLSTIINIGDKTAIRLINKYNISSLADFKNKVYNGEIEVNEKIKLGLKYLDLYKTHIPRQEITTINYQLDKLILNYDKKYIFVICGSYRRNSDYSNDIDILLTHENILINEDIEINNTYLSNIIDLLKKNNFIIDDLTVSNKTKYMGFYQYSDGINQYPVRRIDIRMMAVESFFPALIYFTGSYEFNKYIRLVAKKQGYILNEYGLFNIKTNKSVLITDEKMIFNILNIKYLNPIERN